MLFRTVNLKGGHGTDFTKKLFIYNSKQGISIGADRFNAGD